MSISAVTGAGWSLGRRVCCVRLSRGLVVGGVDNVEDRPDHPITARVACVWG